jgi:hypothetical protein
MATQGQLIGYRTAMDALRDTSSVNLKSAVKWLVECIDAYAEYRGSAALYEELRRLSDAELRQRGLRRETLARHAFGLRD